MVSPTAGPHDPYAAKGHWPRTTSPYAGAGRFGDFCAISILPGLLFPSVIPSFSKRVSLQPLGSQQLYFPHLADRRRLKSDTTVCACISYYIGGMNLYFQNHRVTMCLGHIFRNVNHCGLLSWMFLSSRSRQQSRQRKEAGLLSPGQPARLGFSPAQPCFSFSGSLKQR